LLDQGQVGEGIVNAVQVMPLAHVPCQRGDRSHLCPGLLACLPNPPPRTCSIKVHRLAAQTTANDVCRPCTVGTPCRAPVVLLRDFAAAASHA
jgi:hypothetical protein